MKRLFALLLALCLLAGCAGKNEEAPVWQTELAGGGSFAVSGCTVREDSGEYCAAPGQEPVTLPMLRLDGIPTLIFTGVAESDISFDYAEPDGDIYRQYTEKVVAENMDYILTRGDDGTLRYRLDTVYSFRLTVGPEQWLLVCTRDI